MEALEQRLGVCGEVDGGATRICMGEIMPCIRDARVRHIASCLYNKACTVSPDDLHRMICNEEWTNVASLLPTTSPTTTYPDTCVDHRVLGSSLHDLCPAVVQNVWCDADASHRWFRGVYTYGDPRHARLASCASLHIFCHQRATLQVLSDALDRYRTHDLVMHHVSDDWNVSSGTWGDLRDAVATSVGHAVSLVVVSRVHRSAFSCVVASHEWMLVEDDSTVLHHRGHLSVTLRYVRQTFGGVVALEVEDSDEWWPPFILENRMVPPSMFPSLYSSSPCIVSLGKDVCCRRKRSSIDVDELTSDRHVRSVIRTWNKSYESRYADAPTLTSIACVQLVETLIHQGYVAHRVHTSTSQYGIDAEGVLVGRFGNVYGTDAMRRTLADKVAGLYAVYDSDRVCVSTFAIVIYNTFDGRLACCVDSFAVSVIHQGSGVGNVTFHALLRGMCDRASVAGTPYIVFAQCVRTGDARHFWYDKLDESTVARSLILQAFHIDPVRVPVQSTSQCAPRAREYRSSDLKQSV
jgi:hypothetical protein